MTTNTNTINIINTNNKNLTPMSYKDMYVSAIDAMTMLGVDEKYIECFADRLTAKCVDGEHGIEFFPSDSELVKINEVEQTLNGPVYYIAVDVTPYGVRWNLFIVSPYKEDWKSEMELLRYKEACVYCLYPDQPEKNRFECIEFGVVDGKIVRVSDDV